MAINHIIINKLIYGLIFILFMMIVLVAKNMENINSRLIKEFAITMEQAESVIQLLDEGNTVPFIARYRKERTRGTR